MERMGTHQLKPLRLVRIYNLFVLCPVGTPQRSDGTGARTDPSAKSTRREMEGTGRERGEGTKLLR